jgi:hypothetical protein
VRRQDVLVEATARWIATATLEANNQTTKPHRDSEASKRAALVVARQRQYAVEQPRLRTKIEVVTRPLALGGHRLQRIEGAWACHTCKRRSKSLSKLAPQRCGGSVLQRWDIKAKSLAGHGHAEGGDHVRVRSGEVIWCTRCGSYAESAAKGLTKRCMGRFQGNSVWGGLAGQLRKLMIGRHPVTGVTLPPPIPEAKWNDHGSVVGSTFQVGACSPSPGSRAYVDTETVRGSSSFAALRERVRAKEAATLQATVRPSMTQQHARRRISGKRKAEAGVRVPCELHKTHADPAGDEVDRPCKRHNSLAEGCSQAMTG